MPVYHGGYCAIAKPEIRTSRNKKDFGPGFYCTGLRAQADKWASRFDTPVVSIYEYIPSTVLNMLLFETMTDDWLDFIADCRGGKSHTYDIVDGAMADDQIWNYVADFASGVLTREQFWALAKFKRPTHQIVFCTPASLSCLQFIGNWRMRI